MRRPAITGGAAGGNRPAGIAGAVRGGCADAGRHWQRPAPSAARVPAAGPVRGDRLPRRRRSRSGPSRAGCSCCSGRRVPRHGGLRDRLRQPDLPLHRDRDGRPRARRDPHALEPAPRGAPQRTPPPPALSRVPRRQEQRLADVAGRSGAPPSAASRHRRLAGLAAARRSCGSAGPATRTSSACAPAARRSRTSRGRGSRKAVTRSPSSSRGSSRRPARSSGVERVDDVPVAVGLTAAPVLSIVGPPERARACARALAAARARARAVRSARRGLARRLRPRVGLAEVAAARPRDAGGDATGSARRPRRRRAGSRRCSTSMWRRAEQLRALSDVTRPPARARRRTELVLVVDGFSPLDARSRLPLLREALRAAPRCAWRSSASSTTRATSLPRPPRGCA